jgi:hypothetical protein
VSVLLATVHVEQLKDVLLLVLDAHGDEDQVLPRVRGDHLPSIKGPVIFTKIFIISMCGIKFCKL